MGRYIFDQNLFRYFAQMERKYYARPLNLGGSAYGLGSPPGGFVGYLPQGRISYDTNELESDVVPASGISLIDNMNHIRYRLGQLELGVSSEGIYVEEDDVLVASGVIYLNFEGGVNVTDDGSNQVTVTISGSTTDEQVKVSANDTTSNYLLDKLNAGTDIVITELGDGGNEQVQISYDGITTDEFAKVSANDSTPGYLDGKLIAGTYVTLTQVNDGGDEQLQINCTASGISGPDELVKISSDDTTAEYLDTKIVAGTGITINTLYPGLNEQLEIVCTASGVDTDELLKISANDTAAGYLCSKLVAGSGITLEEMDNAGNETLRISSYNIFTDIFPVTSPPVTGYTWYNEGDATVTYGTRKLTLYDPGHTDGDWHILGRTLPSGTVYKRTVGIFPNMIESSLSLGGVGIAIRDTTGNKFINLALNPLSSGYGLYLEVSVKSYSDVSTVVDHYDEIIFYFSTPIYLQIENDGVNVYYRYSNDGTNFRTLYQHAIDTFVSPNQFGYSIRAIEYDVWSTIISYSEE